MIRVAAGYFGELPLPQWSPQSIAVQFSLSPERLSETEILNAGHASAGRLAAELLRRVRRMYPQASACLAFNPRLALSSALIQKVLTTAERYAPEPAGVSPPADPAEPEPGVWIFTDNQGKAPLAYMLRADTIDWCPPAHLGFLVGDNAEVERQFLDASFGPGGFIPIASCDPVTEIAYSFASPVSPALYDFTVLATAKLAQAQTREAKRELVEKSERIGLLGYHAGDVLFLLQALALEQGNHPFTGVVVPRDFADIVDYLSPHLRCFVVEQPVPQRGDYVVSDEYAVLREYVTLLQLQGVSVDRFFWHPLRPCFRDSILVHSRHHLREMTALAIGGSGHELRPLPLMSEASRRDFARARPLPGRVIVQFDAGWGLKGFPAERRGELLRLLQEVGYDPILLGRAESAAPGVRAVPYTDLHAFRSLLDTAEALIGCDSFPAHFANQYGVPTLTLFGSTRPSNARGMDSVRYLALHHPMPCVPCAGQTYCLIDKGTSCYAMPTAGEVVHALEAMLAAVSRQMRTKKPGKTPGKQRSDNDSQN